VSMFANRLGALILASVSIGAAFLAAGAAYAEQTAIAAIVSGDNIQKVGFRAMIQKAAIMYNIAGFARNNLNGSVAVSLQGDEDRIGRVLSLIRAGSKKSSKSNKIDQTPIALDPTLNTFTVYGWTSTSREISRPYDLVFPLRTSDDQMSHDDAKSTWNRLVESVLAGDDLARFMKHLNDDD
jgi:acylphosphatase